LKGSKPSANRSAIALAVGLVGGALTLPGCQGSAQQEVPESPGQASSRAYSLQQQALGQMRAGVRQALAGPGTPHVLAVSGGGQWGAFGAGFLKGWTASGTRPDAFRVVTGTSTGSLISTFAFLGKEYDHAVGQAYLEIGGDDDVLDKRFLPFAALFRDSLAGTKPLRRLIEKHVTANMLEEVAVEAATGRKLYVGAADLDAGVFKAFDLTEIASHGGESARRDYIDALMASTALPVYFPPVEIGGRTYVDGGIRRNVFMGLVVDELKARPPEATTTGETPTVYSLVNGTLNVGASETPRRVLNIAKRSVDILLDESTDGNLLRIYIQAQQANLRFLMTRIPADMCDAVGSKEHDFDPELMACLHEKGQKFAKGPDAWTSQPPLETGAP